MAQVSYPGVYIQEVSSGVHTISSVGTSIAAFIDFFPQGPMDTPVQIFGMADFQRIYGGLDTRSEASYAIAQFFLNGGGSAWVVRVAKGSPPAAALTLKAGAKDVLGISAANPGLWGNNLRVTVDQIPNPPDASGKLFNLTVTRFDGTGAKARPLATERYLNLTMDSAQPRYAVGVINDGSQLVAAADLINDNATRPDTLASTALTGGSDGDLPGATEIVGSQASLPYTGMYALDRVDLFNILCIPRAVEITSAGDLDTIYSAALAFCEQRRAFVLVDVPASANDFSKVQSFVSAHESIIRNNNSALYFPRTQVPDPVNEYRLRSIAASGTMAGVYARTDSTRGVWKAPAGVEAVLNGVVQLDATLTDAENGVLNPLAINCLRTFPVYGNIAWGSRTLEGADQIGSEWKYVPVRRLALMLEESLFRGTKWVVFEPNDEPLWAKIRLNVGAYMNSLFRQGAFQGAAPKDAYFVKCDAETTTENDRNLGIVNILVGFAPLKPAEFVVISIQQIAGDL